MDRLSRVVYINLEHRTDRKQEMEDELKKLSYDKAERLEAYLNEYPAAGCTLNHVRVWRRMIKEGWDSVMVMEDDAHFQVSREEFDGYINAFLDDEEADMLHFSNNADQFDAYPSNDMYFPPINRATNGDSFQHLSDTLDNPKCLCRSNQRHNGVPFYTPRFLRVRNVYGAACYIIKRKMVFDLIKAYFTPNRAWSRLCCEKDMFELTEGDDEFHLRIGFIDQTWNLFINEGLAQDSNFPLERRYNFLIPNVPSYGRVVVQRPSYSDVWKLHVDYKI
jgi:hypothetical protein